MTMTNQSALWNAFVNGVVPEKIDINWLFGREEEMKLLKQCLEIMEFKKISLFKLVEGDYGFGKTMLLSAFKTEALSKGFVVSRLTLGTHNNFSKPEIVYKDIMANMTIERNGEPVDFESIFKIWLRELKRHNSFEEVSKQIASLIEVLKDYNATFGAVLYSYIRGIIKADNEIAQLASAWIVGDYNMSQEQKKRIGVRGNIDRYNAFDILQGFSKMLELLGYKGFVIIVDELEYIMRERQDIRNKSYTTLRHLIDEIGMNRWNNTFFIGAFTPEMMLDAEKGFKSYEALFQRITSGFDDKSKVKNSLDLTIIRLDELSKESLIQLANKLIELSGAKLDTNLMGKLALVEYAKREMTARRKTSIREFIKIVIHVIQVAQINPEMPIFNVRASE